MSVFEAKIRPAIVLVASAHVKVEARRSSKTTVTDQIGMTSSDI
jgi:hypothetical protein